jgi:cytohesin
MVSPWSGTAPALHEAASRCDAEGVERLLKRGANPEERDELGRTALDIALDVKCLEVAKILVPITKPTSRTLMATEGDPALISLLAFYWPEEVRRHGEAVLAWLVSTGRREAAALLIGMGVDLDRSYALHAAARRCDMELVRLLLDRGASVKNVDLWGKTPLHEASCPEVAELLIQLGADVNAQDVDGWTPLHHAAYEGRSAVVKALLKAGADPNIGNKYGRTPLHVAAGQCAVDVVRALLDAGADPNAPDAEGNTPLHEAMCGAAAELLLERGAWPNIRNKYGQTPLHRAACKRPEVAEVLLKYGADPNARSANGWTPLHEAAYCGSAETAELLIKAGADVDAVSRDGLTPLNVAVTVGRYDVGSAIASVLLKRMTGVKDGRGWTP